MSITGSKERLPVKRRKSSRVSFRPYAKENAEPKSWLNFAKRGEDGSSEAITFFPEVE
jgi:hypothetical protein